ncbi:MAG TPA: sigma-70 family RNA polymerase sigma factor [Polyangiaceae bacterium]|nr:sigma-70 family RNA polymerase sigma factor [Polyangiaceae bacterium]
MLRLISGYRRSDPPPPDGRRDELLELAHAVQAGDRAALRTFLAQVVPHLLRVARRVLGPQHSDVEDVAYEAAYAVVEGLSRFRGEGTVLHFACRVAVLTAMNVRRRDAAQKRARGVAGCDPDSVQAEARDPEEQAVLGALAPVVRELLDTLPEPLAEALALHNMLGYTVQEVAEQSGAPVETVRSRLRLAKQALRKRVLGHPRLREVAEPLLREEAR